MTHSESIKELIAATIRVMQEVETIDKSMKVGSGTNAYQGVSDKDVKTAIGQSMAKNGLAIYPIDIEAKENISEWDEIDTWSKENPKPMKRKQSIFTVVNTKYLLCHTSGEWMQLSGYGHGVDPQDKSAGKATTYALKYTLLYTFLVATGKIDDADKSHSDDIEVPVTRQAPVAKTEPEKPWLNPNTQQWKDAVLYVKNGGMISAIRKKYNLTKANEQKIIDESIQGV